MDDRRLLMGLLFYPRGGSAQVARYLHNALVRDGWSVDLVAGSLGSSGETYAPNFFGEIALHAVDYSPAVEVFAAGGRAVAAPVPMHPSYEDREDVPDEIFSAVPDELYEGLVSVWERVFRAAGADRAVIFHLHHLTPQHEAARRWWPTTPIVAHLHGTEIKFVEAVDARAALAERLGTTLVGMADRAAPHQHAVGGVVLSESDEELRRTTRWANWRYGEPWRDRFGAQARAADQLVTISPKDRATAVEVLGVDADRVSVIPNGVDTERFSPRVMSPSERRSLFRRWLVEDPQGWDESSIPGTVRYDDDDLRRLLGPDGENTVLLSVGRFTAVKRLPLLIRAFARARARFDRPASLLLWGGHPGEWEGEHPVAVARQSAPDGVYFAGWRGHDDLPHALAASDVLVTPSVDDSYPQTALEAMAVGLPVVGADSGGFPFMVNLEPTRPNGWLVPPDDELALADTLVSVVNTPEEVARRGDAAVDYARANFSWASRVPRFEAVYARAQEVRARRHAGS